MSEQRGPEIIDISEEPDPVNEFSRKSASNGVAWGKDGSQDEDGSNSKHRLDESDKDQNEAAKKENTPKRLRTAEISVVDPSPESNGSCLNIPYNLCVVDTNSRGALPISTVGMRKIDTYFTIGEGGSTSFRNKITPKAGLQVLNI